MMDPENGEGVTSRECCTTSRKIPLLLVGLTCAIALVLAISLPIALTDDKPKQPTMAGGSTFSSCLSNFTKELCCTSAPPSPFDYQDCVQGQDVGCPCILPMGFVDTFSDLIASSVTNIDHFLIDDGKPVPPLAPYVEEVRMLLKKAMLGNDLTDKDLLAAVMVPNATTNSLSTRHRSLVSSACSSASASLLIDIVTLPIAVGIVSGPTKAVEKWAAQNTPKLEVAADWTAEQLYKFVLINGNLSREQRAINFVLEFGSSIRNVAFSQLFGSNPPSDAVEAAIFFGSIGVSLWAAFATGGLYTLLQGASAALAVASIVENIDDVINACKGQGPFEAFLYGDPHFKTFDGLRTSCQAQGIFTLVKSNDSPLLIQAVFQKPKESSRNTVTSGVVVRANAESPTVQVFWMTDDSFELRINGQVFNKSDNFFYEIDSVVVRVTGSQTDIFFPDTGLYTSFAKREMSYVQVQFLESSYTGEKIVGLLGSPDGDSTNDWMMANGTVLPIMIQNQTLRFEYCRTHWAVENAADSMFNFPEGFSFDSFLFSEEVYPGDIDTSGASAELLALCESNTACLEDGVELGVEAAADLLTLEAAMLSSPMFQFVPASIPGGTRVGVVVTIDLSQETSSVVLSIDAFAIYSIDPTTGLTVKSEQLLLLEDNGEFPDQQANDNIFSNIIFLFSTMAGESFGFKAIPIINGNEAADIGYVFAASSAVQSFSSLSPGPSKAITVGSEQTGYQLDGVDNVAVNCDGSRIIVAMLGKAFLLDGLGNVLQTYLPTEGVNITGFGGSVDINCDGDRIVIGNPTASNIHVFDSEKNLLWFFQGPQGSSLSESVHISANGNRIVAGAPSTWGINETVYIFNGTDGKVELILDNPSFDASGQYGGSVAINKDGSRIVVGAPLGDSFEGAVYVYDKIGNLTAKITDPYGFVSVSGFGHLTAVNCDGSRIVIGYNGGSSFHLFDNDGNLLVTFNDGNKTELYVNSVAINCDGDKILVGSSIPNGLMYLYDDSGKLQDVIIAPVEKSYRFGYAVAMSSDATVYATTDEILDEAYIFRVVEDKM